MVADASWLLLYTQLTFQISWTKVEPENFRDQLYIFTFSFLFLKQLCN